jgi:tripartite-type tricarboxylate transporter receptor subunit TctC
MSAHTVRRSLIALGLVWPCVAFGQPNGLACLPDRGPVRLIVPFPAGSWIDAVARQMQHVAVENKPGANGLAGASEVAKAAPDGRTLLLTYGSAHAVATAVAAQVPFDPVKDFAPISQIAVIPMVLVANPSFPARNLQDLAAQVKKGARPKLATSSVASIDDLTGWLLSRAMGGIIERVPFQGAANAMNGILGGHTNLIIAPVGLAAPYVKERKLIPYAVTGTRRSALLPDVPTMAEAGIPGIEVSNWIGLFAPRGTPRERIGCFYDSTKQFVSDEGVKKRLLASGMEVVGDSPEEFSRYVASDVARWGQLAKQANLTGK